MSGKEVLENEFGQPVGVPLPDWSARLSPPRFAMEGRYCRVEPINPELHADALFKAFSQSEPAIWTYLPDYMGPYESLSSWRQWIESTFASEDPLWHAIVDNACGRPLGLAAYLRIDNRFGSIEVGGVIYSKALQRTPAATEAMYLMMRRVFDELGYRRYEWKCDSLNVPSRAAAQRLGFTFEGVFRQHMVYRGRNRDTAWFSIIDKDWPDVRNALENWLNPENFDTNGGQRARLHRLRN